MFSQNFSPSNLRITNSIYLDIVYLNNHDTQKLYGNVLHQCTFSHWYVGTKRSKRIFLCTAKLFITMSFETQLHYHKKLSDFF